MVFTHKIDLNNWKEKLQNVVFRFPLTVLFATISCLTVMYVNHHVRGDVTFQRFDFFLMLYPLSGMVLSLMLHLWTEDVPNKTRGWSIQAISHALWLALCAYWAWQFPLTIAQSIACGVSIFGMFIGWVTLPFVRHHNDMPAINFLIKVKISALLTMLISGLLFLGLLLLVQSFHYLFGIKIEDPFYMDCFIFATTLVAPLLLVARLPHNDQKHSHDNWLHNKFGNGIIHFILIPLYSAYLITLYAYAVKILITWQLPNGWVSWLVSVLMLLSVILVGLLYPTTLSADSKRFDRILVKWIPILMLPLLVLMTIAISRRLSDYGVTIQRIYLVLFNLWCYAVCITLIINRNRRVMWIAMSFGLILIATSLFPYNVSRFTRQKIQQDVRQLITSNNVDRLPMNRADYEKLIRTVGYQQAKLIDGKLSYLQETVDKESTKDLLDNRVELYTYQLDDIFKKTKDGKGHELSDVRILSSSNDYLETITTIPQNYRYALPLDVSLSENEFSFDGQNFRFKLDYHVNNQSKTDTFKVPIERFEQMADLKSNGTLAVESGGSQLVITYFRIKWGGDYQFMNLTGILYIK